MGIIYSIFNVTTANPYLVGHVQVINNLFSHFIEITVNKNRLGTHTNYSNQNRGRNY